MQTADITKQVNEAVASAVAQAHEQDARMLKAAEIRHDNEHRMLIEAITVLQDRRNLELTSAEGQ